MSWGERSCKHPCRAPKGYCDLHTCNVDCPDYVWDTVTPKDSTPTIPEPVEKRLRTKNGVDRAIALSMMAGMGGVNVFMPKLKDRKIKKCLVYEKEHTHNNSFCSAVCCKKYQAVRRRR